MFPNNFIAFLKGKVWLFLVFLLREIYKISVYKDIGINLPICNLLSRDGSRRRGGGNDTPRPVELTLSSSQKWPLGKNVGHADVRTLVTLGRRTSEGERKWSQLIGGDPKRKWGSLPLSGSEY